MMRPIFIEFYGLPGSGKSTLSHNLAGELRNRGFYVKEASYEIDKHGPFLRRIYKFLVCSYWLFFHHSCYAGAKDLVRENGYVGKEAFLHVINVIQIIGIYNRNTESDFILLDQGLIQAAISLSVNGKIAAYENFVRLVHLTEDVEPSKSIFVDVDVETSLQRMHKRSTNYSRVEKLRDDKKKLEMMASFVEGIQNYRSFRSAYGSDVQVDNSVVIDCVVEFLLDNIICHE